MTGSRSLSHVADLVARSGLPPTAGVGVRMAVEPGRGRTAVPVRSALAGTVVALASVVAAFTFVASLEHLVNTPHLYGWNWHLAVDTRFISTQAGASARDLLIGSDDVSAVSAVEFDSASVGGVPLPVVRVHRLRGELVAPTVVEGRPPNGGDEMLLGTETLRKLGLSVGQTASVRIGERESSMRVVLRAVFPAFAGGTFEGADLGEGALVGSDLDVSAPGAVPNNSFFLVRFTPGTDSAAVSIRLSGELSRAGCAPPRCDGYSVLAARLPPALSNYSPVRWTPLALAGLLVVLAVSTLSHTLAISIRRRRRDFAVLKAVGFVHGQVSAAVAWQATTLVSLALLVGLPLGVVAGRWLWRGFAVPLGITAEPVLPGLPVLLAIPVTLVVTNVLAAWPARTAARIRPAAVLRTD